jgi:hypothetical protein
VMETEYVSNSMEIVIGEIGKLELRKVKVGWSGMMEELTMVNGKMIRMTEKGAWLGLMGEHMSVIGITGRLMGKV